MSSLKIEINAPHLLWGQCYLFWQDMKLWFRHSWNWGVGAGGCIVDMVSDTFLHHWELEFSELYQTQGYYQPFSKQYLLIAASCNLMGSRSLLATMQPWARFLLSEKQSQTWKRERPKWSCGVGLESKVSTWTQVPKSIVTYRNIYKCTQVSV